MNNKIENAETGTFEGSGGCKLFYKIWTPQTSPKAVVTLVHGVGEYIDRHHHLIEALIGSGYAAAGFDLRGHGRSEGQRGHIRAWEEYRQDLRLFLDRVRARFADLPLFIYGHSLGSLIVLDFILHHPAGIQGAILSGTALEPKEVAPFHLKLIAQLLSRVKPTHNLKMPLPGESLSRDPQVAQAYMQDPLVFWDRSVRWGAEGMRIIPWIKRRAAQIQMPTLFIHGEDDPLLSVEGARRFFEQIQFPDKTLKIYPGSRHEPHNDLDYPQVMGDIIAWLEAHV